MGDHVGARGRSDGARGGRGGGTSGPTVAASSGVVA